MWRAARERGAIAGLAPKKRGPKVTPPDPRDRKIVELERENAAVKHPRLERAEALVDLQKKVSMLLGMILPERDEKP